MLQDPAGTPELQEAAAPVEWSTAFKGVLWLISVLLTSATFTFALNALSATNGLAPTCAVPLDGIAGGNNTVPTPGPVPTPSDELLNRYWPNSDESYVPFSVKSMCGQEQGMSCDAKTMVDDRAHLQTMLMSYEVDVKTGKTKLTTADEKTVNRLAKEMDEKAAIEQAPLTGARTATQDDVAAVAKFGEQLAHAGVSVNKLFVPISKLRFVLNSAHPQEGLEPVVHNKYTPAERYMGRIHRREGQSDIVTINAECQNRARTPLPANDKEQCPAAYQKMDTREPQVSSARESFLVKIPNALLGQCGHVYDGRRVFWNDANYKWIGNCCYMGGDSADFTLQPRQKAILPLFGPCWPYSFQHFAQDQFGKLGLVIDFLIAHPEVKVVVEGKTNPPSASVNWLLTVGLTIDRIIAVQSTGCGMSMIPADVIYFPGSFPTIFPSPGPCVNDFGPKMYDNLRNTLRKRLAPLPEHDKSKLRVAYISRGKTGSRSVPGETEILNMFNAHLEQRGQAKVEFIQPTPDMKKWLTTLANVDIIVAPHGGAVPNLAACRQGTIFIEFTHFCQPSYETWARLMGFVYYQIPSPPKEHSAPFGQLPPTVVDTFLQALEAKGF